MKIADVHNAVLNIPHVVAGRRAGEWRISISINALMIRYPGHAGNWYAAKQEELAYFTDDGEDAIGTARIFSETWSKG